MTNSTDREQDSTPSREVRVRHEFEDGSSVASSVVTAVSRVNGVDPIDLPSLYETIDGDALDALLTASSTENSDLKVVFQYAGTQVTVTGDGTVTVVPEK